ncbi:MAG: tRNA (adenosine(37)-N6)-dimethylallyltransferase MiaA [Candidatus Portnoybacteria bacterium RBG_19FT_COMBO_36_7]|uniref:tRNA dimethylallyltransferase n=1 Tax=Candidatus Portnoybacteria bacterium RBG_19FT_COMBO_36_7 TaxID=1801992 RepID=A0A1G2F951_9BACT|nr:MAG: tRNA (adenosine(37)-N6)-dimethylallyltransferase MiaA [Candidatus Portnoybacteria bacterium RBG_19FT_COMBO_36_7]
MTNTSQQKLIVILGPNASGKSKLAVELAKKFNGEIISADSRQVYRGMDTGTGKIKKKEMRGIPHYLLDVASPKKRFTVAQYKKLALAAIKKIQRKNKIPIICGGTGFYIQALADNISIPEVKPDLKLRRGLEKKSAQELFTRLKKLDPNRAKNIDRYNKRRLVRALEIIYKTGKLIPKLKSEPQFKTLFLGVKKSPVKLKKLIHTRLQKRLAQDMIKEVQNLRKFGLSWKKLDDFGLEYRWIARFLQKQVSRNQMIARLQKDIEHYAKRQMTWFKKYPGEKTLWISNKKQAQTLVNKFLSADTQTGKKLF